MYFVDKLNIYLNLVSILMNNCKLSFRICLGFPSNDWCDIQLVWLILKICIFSYDEDDGGDYDGGYSDDYNDLGDDDNGFK